jgi:methyl-accepting chemotaxis protein
MDMLSNQKLGTKISLGFAALIVIAAVIGGVAVSSMKTVQGKSDVLVQEYIPEVKVASAIERYSLTTMYAMRGYGLSGEEKYLSDGRKSLAEVKKYLADATTLAEESKQLVKLKAEVGTVAEYVSTYEGLVEDTVQANTDTVKHRSELDVAAAAYMKECMDFLAMQYEMVQEDLDAGVEKAMLEERLKKITVINAAIELGNECRVATWKAQARRDLQGLQNAQKYFAEMDKKFEELKPITRKEVNIQQIAAAKVAAADYKEAMSELLIDEQALEDLGKTRDAAASRVLQGARDTASKGIERTETSTAEVNKSLSSSSTLVVTGLVIATVMGIILAIAITRGISVPVKAITNYASRIAGGDLDVEVLHEDRGDEIGQLAQSFKQMSQSLREQAEVAEQIAQGNLAVQTTPRSDKDVLGNALSRMVKSLREQTQAIVEAADVLLTTTNEVLVSSSQLAASATETSTAVSQTTTTVEEVKQTSQSSNEKAKQISQEFQQTAQISQAGEKATQDTINGMNLIKEQMESIAENIVRLSEQSQTVGEIISSVDDIAEQSNLLAVNAAVEAARAGEQGKGFAVVAEEIKTLAEQSKRATTQVRSILGDIQQATSSAVMVTEQGGKVVDAGSEHTAKAGESIRTLTGSVTESVQAATQIAASSQQQLVGMEQIAQAMESIKLASEQNLAGTKRLEEAAQGLKELGNGLQKQVQQYTL